MPRSGRILRSVLVGTVPGIGQFILGKRLMGMTILGGFLFFPAVIALNAEHFVTSMLSLLYTSYLGLVTYGEPIPVLQPEVVDHWIASLFCILAPMLIWVFSRRHMRRELTYGSPDERSEWSIAWSEFARRRGPVAALIAIMLLYSIALLCPFLAPYDPNAFTDGVVTQFRKPLSSVIALRMEQDRHPRMGEPPAWGRSDHESHFRYLRHLNTVLIDDGMTRLTFVDAWHVEDANVVATKGRGYTMIPIADLASPDPAEFETHRMHYLGTDTYGRDILSRLIYGSRISLSLGLVSVLLSVTLGSFVGVIAGYSGRMVDTISMRFVDVLLAFPTLFLILTIIAVFEKIPIPRIFLIITVLGLTSWMGIARIVRSEVLSLREREFVVAARALGVLPIRIMIRHILPNAMTPVIVNSTLRIGGIILIEAALSFLNLGVQQPTASWGSMIFEGKDFLATAWWISTLPGIAIVITVVCFNIIGDGLRDAFDPMLKGV